MTLPLVIGLVAATVVLSPILVRVIDKKAGYPLAALLFAAAAVLGSKYTEVSRGTDLEWSFTWARDVMGMGTSVDFALRADGLSIFFALLALVIGGVVFLYSAAYLPERDGNTSFYTIMTAFTLSVLLLVLANDVVLLFIGWELVSIASFLLIARSGSSGEAGSYRTLILTFFGGLTLLTALAIAAVQAGTTSLSGILAADFWAQDSKLVTGLAVLIALSAFTKAAQFPFHFWLPEAMAAATPVSAFLHAAAVVKAGIYLLLRFSTVFAATPEWNWLLIITGLFTALMSATFAITKTDLKHLTAYSTVSHLGWIVAAIGVGTPVALAAALTHTLAHALFKSSLFMLIGVVDHEAGSRDIRRLGPLYNKMPFTFASTVVAAASMAAVPPLFGFVSKESILAALQENPQGMILLVVAGIAAFLTFLYSAKIVFGAFVDGPKDMSHVHEAPVSLWLPAALPGLMSAVVPFMLPQVASLVSTGVTAITGEAYEAELHIFHGVNAPFIVSMIVLAAGILFVLFARRPFFARVENKELLPTNGNEILSEVNRTATSVGKHLGSIADGFNPSRHLFPLFFLVVALGLSTALLTDGVDGVPLAPRAEGIDVWWDLIPFGIILASVVGMCRTRSRLATTVLLGTVGVGMTLQMFMLGAPDVALTQFLVEALTVVVMLMVLRFQPRTFPETPKRRQVTATVFAALAGITAFLGVWSLLGRRERSELAMWFLTEGGLETHADNIVAVIIVEFRGFDTLGELSVLGMAAVVIMAVTSSVPRHKFEAGTRPRPFGQSQFNTLPLRKATTLVMPVLVVLSIVIFFRAHNAPGGGFVAALVLATGFALSYLSRGADTTVVNEKTPVRLIGWGIIVAISSGFLGLIEGGFLYSIYGEIAGQHFTTAMIFDAGIYMCVVGMVTQAINSLGGYLRPGAEVSELVYTRSEAENPLPNVPEPDHPENAVDAHPAPLNPAEAPRSVLSKELD
ncbi:DUF4040 family protein [Corynebacterium sp. TA-R-1]|uniref:DUF4040 family protein n=1 Tax=Corynebacterium stercoris TaxID=2943490 RepID=A0ABT1G2B3_9CORY|nr:DUF4040 family protein [Corynebacterium stercoris]MCP1388159.1 DUF4040 family protein [Corynebacterium stercoris]